MGSSVHGKQQQHIDKNMEINNTDNIRGQKMSHTMTNLYNHPATSADIYLQQLIDLDGYDNVVVNSQVITQKTGRPTEVGVTLTITDEAWSIIQECLALDEANP